MFPAEAMADAIACYYLLVSAGVALIIAVLACVYIWFFRGRDKRR
jgi:hypothetical protein